MSVLTRLSPASRVWPLAGPPAAALWPAAATAQRHFAEYLLFFLPLMFMILGWCDCGWPQAPGLAVGRSSPHSN